MQGTRGIESGLSWHDSYDNKDGIIVSIEILKDVPMSSMVEEDNTRKFTPHLGECLDDSLTEKQKDLIMILEVFEVEQQLPHESRYDTEKAVCVDYRKLSTLSHRNSPVS
jgi:hypothetical protein